MLNQVASRAPNKWKEIGLQLGIQSHQLNSINHHDPIYMHCYMDMFSLWEKKAEPPFTWATIIDALRSPRVLEIVLAHNIEMQLGSSSEP